MSSTTMPQRVLKRVSKEPNEKAAEEGGGSCVMAESTVHHDCASYVATSKSLLMNHHSDIGLPEYSSLGHCLATSLVFLAHLQDSEDVLGGSLDGIMGKADLLYHRMRQRYESTQGPIRRDLNFEDLPDTVETDRGRYAMMRCVPSSGFLLQNAPKGWESCLNLSVRLEGLGTAYSQALLIVGSLCVSVFRDNKGRFGFFHRHPHNVSQACCARSSDTVVATFDTVADLANQLVRFFCSNLPFHTDKEYYFLPVFLNKVVSVEHVDPAHALDNKDLTVTHHPYPPLLGYPKPDPSMEQSVPDRLGGLPPMGPATSHSGGEYVPKKRGRRPKQDCVGGVGRKITMTERYWLDSAYRERQKQRSRDRYREDPVFREKRKQRSREYYRCKKDPTVPERIKQSMRERYWNDPVFREKQKQYMRERYRNDPVFRERQKQRSRECYQTDPVYRLKHKESMRLRKQGKAAEKVIAQLPAQVSNTQCLPDSVFSKIE